MGQSAIITWNLHGRPRETDAPSLAAAMARVTACIELLVRHLASSDIDRAVAVFQEVPDNFEAILISATNATWSVAGAAEHHAVVAMTGPLTVKNVETINASVSGAGDRAVRVDIDGLLPTTVRVVGVHWLDRLNHPPSAARHSKGGKFWSVVRQQWEFPETPHFIVLGDLNENPFDHALVSRECLWAIRDRSDLDGKSKHPDGRPPLFNPMWRFLPETDDPPHGTHEYLDNDESGIRWAHLDQILLSPSAVGLLKGLEILVALDGVAIVTAGGKPDKVKSSDHLPVMAILGA